MGWGEAFRAAAQSRFNPLLGDPRHPVDPDAAPAVRSPIAKRTMTPIVASSPPVLSFDCASCPFHVRGATIEEIRAILSLHHH